MRDRTSAVGGAGAEEKVRGMSPVRAFFLLGAVAAIVPLTMLATRPEAAPATSPEAPRPDFSLTDAEAIAEFEELNGLLVTAYRDRDVTLVGSFAAPGSDLERRVTQEIRLLLRDGVIDATRTRTLATTVTTNEPDRIQIKHVVIERPRFLDAESHRDITKTGRAQRQSVAWSLELINTEWRLSRAVIEASSLVGGRK